MSENRTSCCQWKTKSCCCLEIQYGRLFNFMFFFEVLLVAFCELISKGFLTFKACYSGSSRLRKLKILYIQGIMTPFRCPDVKYELALANDVAKYFPEKPQEWNEAAKILLSKAFLQVKGRGCREKMDRTLLKYTKLQLLSTSLVSLVSSLVSLATFDYTFGWFPLTV